MAEVPMSDTPDMPDEHAVAVREFSAEARGVAVHNMVAAQMYHQVQTGTPDAIRQAAQWIVTEADIKPRSLRLDDDAYLTEQKLTHLTAAQEKVEEAGRIEAWAGSLLAGADSPDIVALKTLKRLDGLLLTDIERRPGDMLEYEDETAALGERVQVTRAEIADITEKLEQGVGIETINVTAAIRERKPKATETVTGAELAARQRDILTEEAETQEAEFRNRTELMEALRSGQLSERLRGILPTPDPEAGSEADEPADGDGESIYALPVEELELGARAYNCLVRSGLTAVGDLLGKTEVELRAIPNFGDRSIDEVIEALAARGLSLRAARLIKS